MPAPQMHKFWPSYIVLAAGLAVAVLAATYVKRSIDSEEDRRVDSTAQLVQQTLAGEIERYTDVLLAARSFFDSTEVSRTDFHSFATSLNLETRFPGMLALGFAPIVTHDKLPVFLKGIQNEHYPDFHIFPPGDRPLYTPIVYIEPFNDINRRTFGFDMFSEQKRHDAMNEATRDDRPTATARVKLVQDPATTTHADFLIYVPVYDQHAELGTPTQRTIGLHGFVYSAYRIPDLIVGLTRKRSDFASVNFQIFDGPDRNPAALLYDSRTRSSVAGATNAGGSARESVGTITVASRPWTLVVRPSPALSLSVDHNLPWLILLAGALVSWLLFGVSWLQMRARAQSDFAAARLADSESLLRESELRYRLKIEQSPLAVQTISPDGTTLSVNRAWEELWGASLDDLQGYNIKNDAEFERARVKNLIRDAFSGSSVSLGTFHYSPAFPSGKRTRARWVRSFLYPVKDINSHIKELVLIHQDVTDRKQAEEELQRAKDAAEAANHAKDQFLAVLSHELRNPLAPVLSMVNLLEDPNISAEESREAVDTIRRNVELEARLIDDLLDVTRIARGKMHLDIEVVDAHTILNHALQICREDADAKRIRIHLDLAAAHHAVNADPARLQQVCWNLIKNAVKFTPDGGELSIRTVNEQPLDPAADAEQFVLSVADTGIGIDPQRLHKVFDAFEQADRSITRRFGGLGLGLAITKALVDAHHGAIAASSDGHGKGAAFTVRLPVTRAPLPVRRERDPSDSAATSAGAPAKPLRILIVEDQADARRGLRLLLEHHGYEVKAAATAQEAIDIANTWNYDLLISDIGLPDLSGFDLLARLRTRRTTPAIALTGFGMEQDIQRARDAGFDLHLTKPIQFERLEQAIQTLTTPKPAPA